jgi:cbb3-type cytochrome oxidase maturation protein
MEVIYVLLPIVLCLAALAVAAFFWSLRNGQFDDLTTPGIRVLFDEDEKGQPEVEKLSE